MKAIGYFTAGKIDREDALVDLDLPIPIPEANDLRVKISAISVNPVDTKVRNNRVPKPDTPEILGWDAVGIVDSIGSNVSSFSVGDRVYYAGTIDRPGTNSEYHLVDYRIASKAPKSLSDEKAAALPLTTITAWELLFDRLRIPENQGKGQHLLIIGGAGGVGSILIQLARQLTQLTIIATASRPETKEWCQKLGAHHVIDHSGSFAEQLNSIGIKEVELAISLTHTDQHWNSIVEVVAPQGKLALIDDPANLIDIKTLKLKSISLHWELMFTRSMFKTHDMSEQGNILKRVADLVDARQLTSTLTEVLSPINASNLRKAHQMIESGKSRGKIVLKGF